MRKLFKGVLSGFLIGVAIGVFADDGSKELWPAFVCIGFAIFFIVEELIRE